MVSFALSLSSCAGYRVVAADGPLGVVETPLFPPDAAEPDFLVVCVGSGGHVRRPVVSTALVANVDPARRTVALRGVTEALARLPEHLPITS